MRFICIYLSIFAACLYFNAPVWAQKTNIKKTVKKAVQLSKQATPSQAGLAMQRAWKASALKEAKQTDRLFKQAISKANQAQLHQLADAAFSRMYNKDYGLLQSITDLWSELLIGYQVSFLGPGELNPRSPMEMRKKLLQKETRLNYALKKWRELKTVFLKTAGPQQYTEMAQAHTATRFFFETSPALELLAKEIALYAGGQKDLMHILAPGQPDIEYFYHQLLAFAHGKASFPFFDIEVYRILELHKYSMSELTQLYADLDSAGCKLLRAWGWKDAEIRKIIRLYQSKDWAQPYQSDHVLLSIQLQHDLISNWRAYWEDLRPHELEATGQLINRLNTSR